MNWIKLEQAEREAKRFLDRVRELKETKTSEHYVSARKQSGAVRRSSMDLTRALAELRRWE